jgi:hypothetical protein
VTDVKDPNRVRVVGPLAEYADGFRRELAQDGYAPASATRQLELMANMSRWLADEGLPVGGLTPARVEMFVIARGKAGFQNRARPDRLVRYLRSVGAAPRAMPLLSTYLGHTDPSSSYWYLQALPELMALVARRFDSALGGGS